MTPHSHEPLAAAGGALAAPARGPQLMRNTVQEYAWGSRTALARLQRRSPDGTTEAELWMGAHPLAPSRLLGLDGSATSLADLVAADPAGTLGADCLARFGARLPFLLKVLAVDAALSVQVHPSAAQAAALHARGRFGDPWPKPELLVAVTPVEALAGWRAPSEAAALLDLLDGPRAERLYRHAASGGAPAALEALAAWPAADRPALADEVAAAVRVALAGSAVEDDPGSLTALMAVHRLLAQHPGDPLVLAPLVLRHHRLAPGEALFVPPGVAHAYLAGVGVEIMAASDNVVRAGLTRKEVDLPLLLDLLSLDAEPVVAQPLPVAPGEVAWAVGGPGAEFALTRLTVTPGAPVAPAAGTGGPQILLCLTGAVEVTGGGRSVGLRGGESAFVPAGTAVTLAGDGEVYRAFPGAGSTGEPA